MWFLFSKADLIHSISGASRQQAETAETITRTMESIGDISKNTSEASQKTALSMKKLAQTSDQLRVSVETFKLENEDDLKIEHEVDSTLTEKEGTDSPEEVARLA